MTEPSRRGKIRANGAFAQKCVDLLSLPSFESSLLSAPPNGGSDAVASFTALEKDRSGSLFRIVNLNSDRRGCWLPPQNSPLHIGPVSQNHD